MASADERIIGHLALLIAGNEVHARIGAGDLAGSWSEDLELWGDTLTDDTIQAWNEIENRATWVLERLRELAVFQGLAFSDLVGPLAQ